MEDSQLLEQLSAEVHNAWWDEKKKQGFHAPLNCPHRAPTNEYGKFEAVCEKCHTDMYPYEELAENIKEYDRVTVRACLKAIEGCGYEVVEKKQEDCMVKLKHDLLTDKYTTVYHEPPNEMNYNAPHRFIVAKSDGNIIPPEPLAEIHFQEGPIKECGVNGVCNEDLIAMVITRLEHFQKSEFSCRENALCITKLEEALLWLRKRTMGRGQRGVEGTHTK